MTGILSFPFISLVTLGARCVVVAVEALGAAAEEVVIVQQLLLPGLGGQLGVQVADPGLLEGLDPSEGGHGDGGAGE